MKFCYQFRNLLGAVYKKGDILFSSDGNAVISPVGNKISVFDLKTNRSYTLPVESKYDFQTLALSPNGKLLIAINEVGVAHLISMTTLMLVYTHRFGQHINCIKFSPDGKFLAVGKGHIVQVFRSPGLFLGEYNPFILERTFDVSYDDVMTLGWSDDSRLLFSGSRDGMVKILAICFLSKFRYCLLGGHSDTVIAAFFEQMSLDISTVSRNGRVCIWQANLELSEIDDRSEDPISRKVSRPAVTVKDPDNIDESRGETAPDENEQEKTDLAQENGDSGLLSYKLLLKGCVVASKNKETVTCAAYNSSSRLLVSGLSNGTFNLHELPECTLIHSLSVMESEVSRLSINCTGDWVAIASQERGQLLVWEWQSETYIMKQQGHSASISTVAYSFDGMHIATGGEDGKVKVWSTHSGFCIVTFKEHSAAVTCVQYSTNGKFIISASVDGTVKAFDMTRYRNFRTLTSTKPVQFISVAMDSSNEFVAAGCQDNFDIHLWSLKLGRLLEVLSGHEGPVVSLCFNPSPASTELASVSWDKTLRVWNAIEATSTSEAIKLFADGLVVSYAPSGKEVMVSTQDGQLLFFDPSTAKQLAHIEGKNDLSSGRSDTDLVTAKTTLKAKAFTTVCYSADGNFIIAGGKSKYVCIYSRTNGVLMKKFEVTQNRSLDSVDDVVHRRNLTEFGNLNLVEDRHDLNSPVIRLPGVRKGDMAARKLKPEVRIFSIKFSPNGQDWAAATTEGLLIYSVNNYKTFNPFQLEEDIKPISIFEALNNKDYSQSIIMSLKLNEVNIIRKVLESIPPKNIPFCVSSLSDQYSERLLNFLSSSVETSRHLEFYLKWLTEVLLRRTVYPVTSLVYLQKILKKHHQELSKVSEFNKYSIGYLKKLIDTNSKSSDKDQDSEEE